MFHDGFKTGPKNQICDPGPARLGACNPRLRIPEPFIVNGMSLLALQRAPSNERRQSPEPFIVNGVSLFPVPSESETVCTKRCVLAPTERLGACNLRHRSPEPFMVNGMPYVSVHTRLDPTGLIPVDGVVPVTDIQYKSTNIHKFQNLQNINYGTYI